MKTPSSSGASSTGSTDPYEGGRTTARTERAGRGRHTLAGMDDGWPVTLAGDRVVRLGYWGRWPDGSWWAYLWWWAPAEPFRPGEEAMRGGRVVCSGWAWSTSVRAAPRVDYTAVPRIDLPMSPDHWPDPASDWATSRGEIARHQGLMGHPLGAPVVEASTADGPAPGRRSKTLQERAQTRRDDAPGRRHGHGNPEG